MKLFVLVSGFGNNHIEHKFEILKNNIKKIISNTIDIWIEISLNVCVYEDNYTLSINDLLQDIIPPPEINISINVLYHKGIVGEFIYNFASPEIVNGYDYVMLILDDVEIIENIDWEYLLILKENSKSHIISPSMTKTSLLENKNMFTDERNIYNAKIIPQCEYFCYVMDIDSYINKYFPLLDINNPWMWGIDLIFGLIGIRVCLINSFIVHHHYKGESYYNFHRNPHDDMNNYLDKYIKKYGIHTNFKLEYY